MKYALLHDIVPVYQKDSQGNIIYDTVDGQSVARDTGRNRPRYEPAVEFYANINPTGQQEARYEAYGVSRLGYDATFYTELNELPITETSIVFMHTEPEVDSDGYVIGDSADYRVVRKIQELNHTTYLLRCLERTEYNG